MTQNDIVDGLEKIDGEMGEIKNNIEEMEQSDELQKQFDELDPEIQNVILERQKIIAKVDQEKFTSALVTMIQRAEMHSILKECDMYIVTVENGIAFFNDEDYDKLVAGSIADLRIFLNEKNIAAAEIDNEVDRFASNLIIHYIDYKKFSSEEKEKVINQINKAKEKQ